MVEFKFISVLFPICVMDFYKYWFYYLSHFCKTSRNLRTQREFCTLHSFSTSRVFSNVATQIFQKKDFSPAKYNIHTFCILLKISREKSSFTSKSSLSAILGGRKNSVDALISQKFLHQNQSGANIFLA